MRVRLKEQGVQYSIVTTLGLVRRVLLFFALTHIGHGRLRALFLRCVIAHCWVDTLLFRERAHIIASVRVHGQL